MTSDKYIIRLDNITWRREDKHILSDVSWTISQGEHWALLGLNGSGKTSILNIINGYNWPTTGQVEVLGHKFGEYDLRLLRQEIGWVSSSLQERLYGYDRAINIVVSGKYASIGLYTEPLEEDFQEARKHLASLQADNLADRIYMTLSQGEKQKILIARALMSQPKLLILDEPCSGLDIFARENLLRTIDQLGREEKGPTLIYVTHHIEEIMPIFDKALLLKKGTVHSQGESQSLLTSDNLTDFFGGPVEVDQRDGRSWLKVI